jgi:FG-GAP repeat
VYLGSASVTGVGPTAASTLALGQANEEFGISVASAGDVNGDGYGDVIVGSHYYAKEGRAYVYLGSASVTGLVTTAAWTVASGQAYAEFGSSVASAGDVNGDGYGDVIVGAHYYANMQNKEGGAFLYSIPAAGRPNLRLSDPSTAGKHPLAPWGALAGTSVRTTARGITPFGRLNIKAEVEAKSLGVPFNGQGAILSPSWTPAFSGGAFQDMVTDVPGLTPSNPYHLRMRFRYRPSEGWPAVASRWFYAPQSGQARGIHFRTGSSSSSKCGNGVLETNEACDDGNTTTGDRCDAACKKEDGVNCALGGECATGFCADGVCCDSPCTGACRACTAQLNGGSHDGKCGNIPADTDPRDACNEDPESTCQQFGGVCDGNGSCRLWSATTFCRDPACTGNVSKRSFCDGFGTCLLEPVGTDCGAKSCDPFTGQCVSSCSTNADCTADAFCDPSTTQCKPKASLGTPCTAPEQCQSAYCVDGVCCENGCKDTCKACSKAKGSSMPDGVCSTVVDGTEDTACLPDPSNKTECGATGTCTASGICALAKVRTPCGGPATCMSATAHSSSCDGEGACMSRDTPCGDYACATTGCKTTCTSNQDCIPHAYCDNSQCKPDTDRGTPCTDDEECYAGHCVELTADAGTSKVCCESNCTGNPCLTGRCTAAGRCEIQPKGQSCGKAACTDDGQRHGDQACNDDGSCAAVDASTQVNCSPYHCESPTSCKTSCSGDADCLSGYECRHESCGPKTCDDTKKCLEGESCDNTNTHTCTSAPAKSGSCTCQMPGQDSRSPCWPAMSLALALLMLRRAPSCGPSGRRV